MDEITFRPNLSFLSQEDKEKIHRAVLKVLSEIGMKVHHDEALALLTDAGCSVQDDGMVKIAEELVLESIDSAPDNIAIYDREANHVMDLGGHRYGPWRTSLVFRHRVRSYLFTGIPDDAAPPLCSR